MSTNDSVSRGPLASGALLTFPRMEQLHATERDASTVDLFDKRFYRRVPTKSFWHLRRIRVGTGTTLRRGCSQRSRTTVCVSLDLELQIGRELCDTLRLGGFLLSKSFPLDL
jgi:hypothetical protein